MNALNGLVRYFISQTIIQEESPKLTKPLQKTFISKTKFPVKIRDIHKIGKNKATGIGVSWLRNTYPNFVKK